MFFLDTSLIISGLTPEIATGATLDWLSVHDASELMISDWTLVEVASAMSIKVRTGQLAAEERSAALSEFHRAVNASYIVLPLASEHFRDAASFVEIVATGIRAADALHVAVARHAGATLVTLDRRLAAAGVDLGIRTELVLPVP